MWPRARSALIAARFRSGSEGRSNWKASPSAYFSTRLARISASLQGAKRSFTSPQICRNSPRHCDASGTRRARACARLIRVRIACAFVDGSSENESTARRTARRSLSNAARSAIPALVFEDRELRIARFRFKRTSNLDMSKQSNSLPPLRQSHARISSSSPLHSGVLLVIPVTPTLPLCDWLKHQHDHQSESCTYAENKRPRTFPCSYLPKPAPVQQKMKSNQRQKRVGKPCVQRTPIVASPPHRLQSGTSARARRKTKIQEQPRARHATKNQPQQTVQHAPEIRAGKEHS